MNLEVLNMPIGAIVGLCVFGFMALFAVLIAIISAVSAVSGFDKPDDRDE